MSMNYTDLTNTLTILAVQGPSPYTLGTLPADFQTMMPRFIEYGEGRIYRDCVFLATRAQDSSLSFTASSRTLDLSALPAVLLVPEGIAAITPVATSPAAGTRWQFIPASLDLIDMMWPQESATIDPSSATAENIGRYFAMRDDHTAVVAPTPDRAYKAEITGLFQPAPISATNLTTYISRIYPEILVAACMVSVAGYLRDYGQQSDDPQLAQSWESQYKALLPGVGAEEQRRRTSGTGWSPNMPTPLATPPRT